MLSSIIITSNIYSSSTLTGTDWVKLTGAIGKGIHKWIVVPKNVKLVGVASGTAGSGKITGGKLTVETGVGLMATAFTAAGLVGADGQRVSAAIAKGFSKSINSSAKYYGDAVGVGVGADMSKVVFTDGVTLAKDLKACFTAIGLNGTDAMKLVGAISSGICSILATGVGAADIKGTPSPIPSTGSTSCSIR